MIVSRIRTLFESEWFFCLFYFFFPGKNSTFSLYARAPLSVAKATHYRITIDPRERLCSPATPVVCVYTYRVYSAASFSPMLLDARTPQFMCILLRYSNESCVRVTVTTIFNIYSKMPRKSTSLENCYRPSKCLIADDFCTSHRCLSK